MQVLLTHAVPHFGSSGDPGEVVRPVFARNYLCLMACLTIRDPPNNLRSSTATATAPPACRGPNHRPASNLAAAGRPRSITIEANANSEGHLTLGHAEQISSLLKTDGFRSTPRT